MLQGWIGEILICVQAESGGTSATCRKQCKRDRLWEHRREFQHGDANLGLGLGRALVTAWS